MAHATDFPERNDYIGKPPSMTDNQCYALPVARIMAILPPSEVGQNPIRTNAHISCWQFTPEELQEMMKNGGKCYLRIIGMTTYPLTIEAFLPVWKDGGEIIYTKEQVDEFKRINKTP